MKIIEKVKEKSEQKVLMELLRVRLSQIIVNEFYKKGDFKVPIHLAFGHEAIAVALARVMAESDQLLLSHRNIHYNLARFDSIKAYIDEYLLNDRGLAQGQLGSMNLANECRGIVYTSNILGNNLAVAGGFSIANSIKKQDGAVFVVTGDGAMEEGAFYESLVFEKSNSLPVIVVVENNHWSLATTIEERRCPIDLKKLTGSLDVPFERLSSNDTYEYIERLNALRSLALIGKTPVCVEVMLTTLGWWRQKTADHPDGKYINYHAGPSPSVHEQNGFRLADSAEDPVFVMEKYFDKDMIKELGEEILSGLKRGLA